MQFGVIKFFYFYYETAGLFYVFTLGGGETILAYGALLCFGIHVQMLIICY